MGEVSILLGRGDGTFAAATARAGAEPQSVRIADMNGDGVPDLAVANFASESVSVLPGNGDGTFLTQLAFAAHDSAFGFAVCDLDGNARPDLVVVTNTGEGMASFSEHAAREVRASKGRAPALDEFGTALLDGRLPWRMMMRQGWTDNPVMEP